jgi:hypothetical protein
MKLWILKPVDNLPQSDDPWKPWYDRAFGFVVRAETEEAAREFAHRDGGKENRWAMPRGPWLDANYSTCDELTADGEVGVVLQDFHAA